MSEKLLDKDVMRRLERLALVSRKITSGRLKGERRSRRRGSSADFADYRNYVAGDDLRFLDWKIYGRLEKLFLKLFLEEEDLRVHILLDVSRSMDHGEPQKLLYAKRVAAALGYICLSKMDSLVVRTFGDRVVQSFGPKRGKVNGARYFDFLSSVETADRTSLLQSFKAAAQGAGGRGVVVVLSDFYDFDGYEEAFRRLFAADFEVLVIHVMSPGELEPKYQGDIKLVDCEFGTTADVSMGRSVLNLYGKTVSAFCNGLKNYVVGRGGCYLLASTADPFELLVLDVLRRRGIVR